MAKSGITTGTCAAIAAKAAARMLIGGNSVKTEYVITPSGKRVEVEILEAKIGADYAECAVRKYSGDDPDITNGVLVYARVSYEKSGIIIEGGTGIGRVTKPGLDQPVGAAAINSVPRRMIKDAVSDVLDRYGADCGAKVVISIPEGVELAKKTFNPRLGIEGGISVLGTSGIVEPMSTKAIIDTIEVELNVRRAAMKDYVIITPGNYGRDYVSEKFGIDIEEAIKCSNYIGDTIDFIADKGFKGFMLIGHAGKLIKLAAGIMNTHSSIADGRMEILCTHAALCGAPLEALNRIMESVTTDDAISILKEYDVFEPAMRRIRDKIDFYINKRCGGNIEYAFLIFSNTHGDLCCGGNDKMLNKLMEEYK
ncbi:MAG: cobalamin biosynthesis protein CbiD [Oscillospiraceae bacterium]|nr:cobalamin biosynthesis protein CbiD [Oscillospiraceae bacterium]